MAPSRALLRCAASVLPRSSPRLLPATCRMSTYVRPETRPALQSGPSRRFPAFARSYSQETSQPPEPPDYLSEGELHVFNKIKAELEPVKLEVQDISGGCGSMYALEIESPKFKGLSVIKQHKLVNQILADEIKSWHGVQLRTRAA
ncbi:bola-like protein [Corynespora cassiicola Philippines]|uniref:Bola-like protein n=1 Tax=Corynespora cassiicola Philippines TaxID=1448308 RepID=A0A2T2PB94_CORCC|nr:bola-like protein [Corynespora cassiicola Philippines]